MLECAEAAAESLPEEAAAQSLVAQPTSSQPPSEAIADKPRRHLAKTYSWASVESAPSLDGITFKLLDGVLTRIEACPTLFLKFRAGLTQCMHFVKSGCPAGVMPHWSVCAGSGMSSMVLSRLCEWLRVRMQLDFNIEEAVAAEKHDRKRDVYVRQHGPKFVVKDMAELSSEDARNLNTNRKEPLPWVFVYDGGIPCTSRAGPSSLKGQNLNCIQETFAGRRSGTATGDGFQHIFNNLALHKPWLVFLECVPNLFEQKEGCQFSDGEIILVKLRTLGYFATFKIFNHSQAGAHSARRRAYWVGMLGIMNELKAKPFFDECLAGGFIAESTISDRHARMEEFIDLDDESRLEALRVLALPSWQDVSHKEPAGDDCGWKVLHKQLCSLGAPWCDVAPVDWPLTPTWQQRKYMQCGGLNPREIEAMCLCDLFWHPQSATEVLDANESLQWKLSTQMADKTGSEWTKKASQTPWHSRVPCDVGSAKIVLRTSAKGVNGSWAVTSVRRLEPYEEFQFQGWDARHWKAPLFEAGAGAGWSELALLRDMAGHVLFCVWLAIHWFKIS